FLPNQFAIHVILVAAGGKSVKRSEQGLGLNPGTTLPLDADRIWGTFWRHRRFGLKLLQYDFDGFLELRIAPGDDVLRSLLDFDVGRHAFVLDDEAVLIPEGEVRRGDGAAIHQHREAQDADEPAPGAFADERAELEFAEHPRKEIAA